MTDLPVRGLVLYKHGVGFFQREGQVDAEEVSLSFRQDAINDVLKSLAAFDRAGGQVLGIHYQTPLDRAAQLEDSSIRLSDQASLVDLLRDLRGREVVLEVAEGEIAGRLVGIDRQERIGRSLVSIVSAEGEVRAVRLKEVRGVRILDERAAHDLGYFLDTSLSEDVRRAVTLRLSPGAHDLVVYYVAPSPTWRVSYRLVAESGEESEGGVALLQGWGLFDNRLDEDLEDVAVTLVAGQPISFIYDLYSSRIPQRQTVQDESRIAPGPIEYEGALADDAPQADSERMMMKAAAFGGLGDAAMTLEAPAPLRRRGARREDMAAAAPPAAEAREAGEFFQYVVTAPVSVRRGESALVPIIGAEIDYGKELLYNGAKLPDHPVAAMRFTNSTGLTLERGPVTVIEDGDYKGEAVVPFTGADNEVYVPFAVELGVRITEHTETHSEMAGLSIGSARPKRGQPPINRGYMIIQQYHVQTVTYTLENKTAEDKTVTIEAPLRAEYELYETARPDVQTAAERRWQVNVPAGRKAEFVRQERRLVSTREQLHTLDYHRLQRFMEGRWLDQETFERLSGLLDDLAAIEAAQAGQEKLHSEREDIYQRQAQLRENMGALGAEGEEGALRARLLGQLEGSEDRLDAIEGEFAELDGRIAEAEGRIDRALDELAGVEG
jgi:hypothetical protein